ncbi:hypothetical protein [Neobacillus endophyticus]|uniref:hypothetical protein n=1 Tax=Neobacillus endophyticus TaxID=2738405 RepID=UPI001C26F82F|nr:hypothetical protein [Neobacillus endophyticus]
MLKIVIEVMIPVTLSELHYKVADKEKNFVIPNIDEGLYIYSRYHFSPFSIRRKLM